MLRRHRSKGSSRVIAPCRAQRNSEASATGRQNYAEIATCGRRKQFERDSERINKQQTEAEAASEVASRELSQAKAELATAADELAAMNAGKQAAVFELKKENGISASGAKEITMLTEALEVARWGEAANQQMVSIVWKQDGSRQTAV